MTFLSVLQHLLQIDATDAQGDVIWDTVGKLVAGASVLSGRSSDAERLLADGNRRLGKAVSELRRRRSKECSSTCQCFCHDDVRQPSVDAGCYRTENTERIALALSITLRLPYTCIFVY